MSNGNAAQNVVIDEAQDWLDKTKNVNLAKCPLGAEWPRGTQLVVKLLLAQMKEQRSQRNSSAFISSLSGGGVGAIIWGMGKLTGLW